MKSAGHVSGRNTPHGRDRYLPEWLLFMLVAFLSLRAAWIMGGGHACDFFSRAWDGLGYYQWLPAVFVTGDFDLMPWTHLVTGTKAISLFTCGVAVLQLPFFLLAQLLTWFFDYPATGYNPVHVVCMMAATATYAGAGAVMSFKLARRFSNMPAAMLAVVSIYAASNLFYYATREPLMSHVYSFFLVSLFCWCGLRVIDGPKRLHTFLFVFSGALLLLVRQLNGVVFLFPLWMAWTSPEGIKSAWANLLRHRSSLTLGLLLGLVPWFLQAIYWHHITGEWYANGYAYKGEHFEWDKMVPGLVLFSPHNGWLVYSPIFLIAIGTLVVHAWRNTRTARPAMLILVLMVLLYSAWWCWWLGGAYGYRGLIDYYGLLAIPLAWFFRSVLRRSWSLRVFTALLLWALVHLNFGMVELYTTSWFATDLSWQRVLEGIGAIAAGK